MMTAVELEIACFRKSSCLSVISRITPEYIQGLAYNIYYNTTFEVNAEYVILFKFLQYFPVPICSTAALLLLCVWSLVTYYVKSRSITPYQVG